MNTPVSTTASTAAATPARIAHQTSGRIRIEVPSRRGDAVYFASLAEQLTDHLTQSGQLARTRTNATAASLALEYSGPLELVLAQLQRCALQLSLPDSDTGTPQSAAGPVHTAWPLNPMTLAGAALGVVGLVQTARGEIMLPALSAFWYAASALRLAHLPTSGRGAEPAAQQSNSTLS